MGLVRVKINRVCYTGNEINLPAMLRQKLRQPDSDKKAISVDETSGLAKATMHVSQSLFCLLSPRHTVSYVNLCIQDCKAQLQREASQA